MYCVLQCFGGCGCGRSELYYGCGMDSLVVDVVEVSVILDADMHSLRSCFVVNNSNLAVVEVFIRML